MSFCVISCTMNFFFSSGCTSHRPKHVACCFSHSLTHSLTHSTHHVIYTNKCGRISCSAARELRNKGMTTKNILIGNMIKFWDLSSGVFMCSTKAPLLAPYESYLNSRRNIPYPPKNFWPKRWPMKEHKDCAYLLMYSRRRNKVVHQWQKVAK